MYQQLFIFKLYFIYLCLIDSNVNASNRKSTQNDKNIANSRRGLLQTPTSSFEDLPRKGECYILALKFI